MSSLRPRKSGRYRRRRRGSFASGGSAFWKKQLGAIRDKVRTRIGVSAKYVSAGEVIKGKTREVRDIIRDIVISSQIGNKVEGIRSKVEGTRNKVGYIRNKVGGRVAALRCWRRAGTDQERSTGTTSIVSLFLKLRSLPIEEVLVSRGTMLLKRFPLHRCFSALSPQAQAVVLGAFLLVGGAGFCILQGPQEIKVNGVPVALAESRVAAKEAILQAKEVKSRELGGRPVEMVDAVEFRARPWGTPLSNEELVSLLAGRLNFSLLGTAIKVNGNTVAVLSTHEEAEQVLESLKARYVEAVPGITVKEVRFAEEVELVSVPVTVEELLSPEQALQRICCGSGAMAEYIVQEGDSLWAIAHRNNLRMEDLIAANPGINPDRLSLGQVIRLARLEPAINVVAVVEKTVEESVPYEVEVQFAADKWRGYRKVLKAGQNGLKEVYLRVTTYNGRTQTEEVLQQVVVREPVKQVEVRGRGYVVASRGSGSESMGRLAWPVRGAITSGYGRRGREFHSGIDIDGSYGEPIVAAESGRVIDTGWDGGYGREIVIDHGGGLKTRYAHCSAILVKPGDVVERGEVIGRVGSSGRSTGSHLHFEVIKNGETVNPLNLLR